jgi:hypothetical protein
MSYNLFEPEDLNKEVLTQNEDFLVDAASFLGKREEFYSDDPEELYDRFMEHFRYQNVNELTATRDLFYAKDADEESKAEMGRLQDTFDRMDSDLGAEAVQDYLGGVFTAPSTYAGIFSFGSGKAATLAAQKGVQLGIKEYLKGAGRTALGSMAVDAPVAAVTTAAQEQTRVETGVKEEVDYTNVGLATALSAVGSGTFGALTGARRTKVKYEAESIRQVALSKEKIQIENAHDKFTKPLLAKNTKTSKNAKKMANTLKMSLAESVPEKIKEGKKLKRKAKLDDRFDPTTEKKVIENISTAAARILNEIPEPKGKLTAKGIKEERITSRLARGIAEGNINGATITRIMKEHDVSTGQLSSLFAEELSSAASKMGAVGRLSQAEKTQALKDLTEIDNALMTLGDFTSGMRTKIDPKYSMAKPIKSLGSAVMEINKARIGMMTVQFATTVRNTTNGYMRNFVYGLDNIGSAATNTAIGLGQKVGGLANKDMAKAASQSLALGRAQAVTGIQSALMKDLWFGTTSVETAALELLFRDSRFKNNKIAAELFREMGDIAEETDSQTGLLWVARKANILNTMSDNMFKRAIFSREIDKALRASGQGSLSDFFKKYYRGPDAGKTAQGKFSQISDDVLKDAVEEALAFTFQIGKFKGKKGPFNSAAQAFIDVTSSGPSGFLLSQGIPFPRYLINQFIFQYEHMPILGMFDLGTGILSKTERKAKRTPATAEFAERLGKQLGGLGMLGAFFQMRVQLGDEGTGPYQYKNPVTGTPINAEANLGPFMGYAMIADLIYRGTGPNRKPIPFGEELGLPDGKLPQLHDNDKVAVDIGYTTREIAQAFTGGTARAGVGLDALNALAEYSVAYEEGSMGDQKFDEMLYKTIGNFFNTFTVGGGMLKDIAATVLPADYRTVQDNTDVDMMEYMLKQAARSIPQEFEPEEGDRPLYRPTRAEPVKNVNPFAKLLLGITEEETKTFLEEELDRLKFDYFELSPRKIQLDAPLSNESRGLMGRFMEREIASYFASPDYKSINNDVLKRDLLKRRINEKRTEARNRVLNIEEGLSDTEKARRWKTKWNDLGSKRHSLVNGMFKQMYPGEDLFKKIEAASDPAHIAQLYQIGISLSEEYFGKKELQ